jgi:hypothetical protein
MNPFIRLTVYTFVGLYVYLYIHPPAHLGNGSASASAKGKEKGKNPSIYKNMMLYEQKAMDQKAVIPKKKKKTRRNPENSENPGIKPPEIKKEQPEDNVIYQSGYQIWL